MKVPGRMGMLITLFLICANVYNSVEAPLTRGFSFIEVWMLGMKIPIMIAILEYGFVLYLMKQPKTKIKNINDSTIDIKYLDEKLNAKIRFYDFMTMILCACFLIMFTISYVVRVSNL